jgi:ATP-dependent RNA helicase DHX8/PRP22
MEECEHAVSFANTKLQTLVETGKEVGDCLIVPLYGMMQSDDQRNVFEEVPDGCRKLIFSTNIAETSLTVAGVGFVVDCGYCKQKNFNPKTGMEALLVTEVSQVQATQRSGRAGRTQAGKCFRLYSEEAFNRSFAKVTVPEILRSNLASVVLQMKAMGIDNVVTFDFMEPPDQVRLVKSLRTLFLLGALDADGKLTDTGNTMSKFPLEPQYSRTLLAAQGLGCLGDAVSLVSILSSEGVWYRPSRKNVEQVETADYIQQQFFDDLGDHTTLLNVFQRWEENGCNSEWCKKHYLHQRALRQARDIRGQLCEQLEKAGVSVRNTGTGRRGGHKKKVLEALCQGFYMQTARACAAGGGYLIVQENVLVTPEGGSAVNGSKAEWLLYSELVGNTIAHCMMRTVSAVDHAWLQPLLPKLNEVDLKRLVGMAATSKKKEVPEKDVAVAAKEKEDKVMSARDRFLARKAAGGKK